MADGAGGSVLADVAEMIDADQNSQIFIAACTASGAQTVTIQRKGATTSDGPYVVLAGGAFTGLGIVLRIGTGFYVLGPVSGAAGGSVKPLDPGFPFSLDDLGGSGSYPDIHITTNTSWTAPDQGFVACRTFTLDAGVTLTVPNGLFLLCKTANIHGTIDASGASGGNGGNANAGNAGAAGSANGGPPGGAGGQGGTNAIGTSAGDGTTSAAVDVTSAMVNANLSATQFMRLVSVAVGFADSDLTVLGFGGSGGGGGGQGSNSTGNNHGGNGGSSPLRGGGADGAPSSPGSVGNAPSSNGMQFLAMVAAFMWWHIYGAGAGGGGGGAAGTGNLSFRAMGGGGGGQGGMPVTVVTDVLDGTSGVIKTSGGNGGNAGTNTTDANIRPGSGGGGGGGGGQNLIRAKLVTTSLPTQTVAGGTGGNGVAGTNGGNTGAAGGNGGAGLAIAMRGG